MQEFLAETLRLARRVATEQATRFLVETYNGVLTRLSEGFSRFSDPLGHTRALLLGVGDAADEMTRAARREEAARARALLDTIPQLPPEPGV